MTDATQPYQASDAPLSTPAEDSNTSTLQAAFPDVQVAVISAVLVASSGNLNKAFDALLGMSDPNFKPEIAPPPVPAVAYDDEQRRQIEADAQYARQLASASNLRRERTTNTQSRHSFPEQEEQERSFLDDDLPIIKENIIQGFNETKTKVNSFISSLRSQYNQRIEQADTGKHTQTDPQPSATKAHGRRTSMQYDADPDAIAVSLDDDFDQLHMVDHTMSQETERPMPSVAAAITSSSKWQPMENAHKETKGPDRGSKSEPFELGDDDDDV